MSDKSNRQFIDTNILVYAHDPSSGEKNVRAQALLQKLWESQQGCLSIQVLQEFYVTATRKLPFPLSSEVVARIIKHLGQWRVHTPDVEDILKAINLQKESQISFWDAMVLNSARALECSVVWSEDLNSKQIYGGVQVLNPFAQ